jgi:hypothetical protein
MDGQKKNCDSTGIWVQYHLLMKWIFLHVPLSFAKIIHLSFGYLKKASLCHHIA